jgi:hypothetical protein
MTKYRIVPNEAMTPGERKAELKQAGLKPLTGFSMPQADRVKPGAFFEPYPDGIGFRFGQGTNWHVRAMAYIGAKQGLHPGKTYRISWLARWEHVNSTKPWQGFYFAANYEPWSKGKKPVVQEPVDVLHFGDSKGWTRESLVLKVCEKPGFHSEFTFRFWGGRDGIAEVRDVAIEAVED